MLFLGYKVTHSIRTTLVSSIGSKTSVTENFCHMVLLFWSVDALTLQYDLTYLSIKKPINSPFSLDIHPKPHVPVRHGVI